MFTGKEIAAYAQDGFIVLPGHLSPEETSRLRGAFERDAQISGDHRVIDHNGIDVRAIYACHQRQAEFSALVRSPRILGLAQQLLAPDLYVYQFKVNAKVAFQGGGWSWHQDYRAWQIADGLPAPRLVNVAIFLDEVNEFNGPVIFVPGSHADGLICEHSHVESANEHLDPDDIALSPIELSALVDRYGMVSAKGQAGSVVFFHPEIVHGSAANVSPFMRRIIIITYNDVQNMPRPIRELRPDYLVGRDSQPLRVQGDVPSSAVPESGVSA